MDLAKKSILIFVIGMTSLWAAYHQNHANLFVNHDNAVIILEEERYVQGEILVGFKPGISVEQGKSIHLEFGTSLISVNDRIGCYRVRIPDSETVDEMIDIYLKDPRVRYAEPNYKCYAAIIPNDPLYGDQWGLPKISAPSAWDIQTGSSSIILSIIDSGVNYNHEDLTGLKVDTANDTDFVNNDNDAMDDYWHGTHCAGIASANTDNSTGMAGVAWNSTILPLKVIDASGGGTYSMMIDALTYAADQGADIISMSLGGRDRSTALSNAIDYAFNQGCLIIASAGNDYVGALSFPGGYNKVLVVGATDVNDNRAVFSQYGPDLDVVAPGVNIRSLGLGNTEYVWGNGTSMSTPHVSGLAALILAQNPSLTNVQIWECIRQTADDVGPAGWDELYGYGRINAFSAVSDASIAKEVALITSPETYNDYFISGSITVTGIATLDYQLKHGSGFNPSAWTVFASGSGASGERTLGTLNVSSVPSDITIIRLELSNGVIDNIAVVVQKGHQIGWPISASLRRGSSSIADIDGDGDNELLTGGSNQVFAWHHDGSTVSGWPVSSGDTRSAPSICDIDDNGDLEIFCGVYDYNQSVRAWHHDGTPVAGWPQTAYYTPQEVSVGDIDGDGDLEMLATGIFNDDAYAWHHNGTIVTGWPYVFSDRVYQTLSLGDLDWDNDLEIVANPRTTSPAAAYTLYGNGTLYPGWPQNIDPRGCTQSSAIGDIDNDGDLEIVGGGFDSLFAWHHDGTVIWRRNASGSQRVGRTPVLCDLDFDGDLEIIQNSGITLEVWNHDGTPYPGFPVTLGANRGAYLIFGGYYDSSPIVGDVDGDEDLEIISAPTSGQPYPCAIHAVHHDGSIVAGWPKYLAPYGTIVNKQWSTPSLCDLDSDGDLEVVIDGETMMIVFDESGSYNPVFMDWPTIHHNLWHNGWYHPEPPLGLIASPGVDWVDLSWNSNLENDIAGYNVYRSLTSGGSYAKVNGTLVTDTTYHDPGLPSPQTYYYVVTAQIHAGNVSHYSSEVSATTIAVLEEPGISVKIPYMTIQSNPASISSGLKITFGLPQSNYVKLRIFDVSGRTVRTLYDNNASPGIHCLKWQCRDDKGKSIPNGIYFVQFDSENFQHIEKVVLLR
jgi:thermitase